jgi:hypothetical protein
MKASCAHVLENAKRGTLIERIGWLSFWVMLWFGAPWSNGLPYLFFSRDTANTAYWAGTFAVLPITFPIFMWLKWRQDRLS